MALVWDHYPEGGGEMLVALKVADHADHAGERIWPGIASLAAQTRQSERSVQRHLRAMTERGWLELVRAGGTGPGATAHYRIPVEQILLQVNGKGDKLSPTERVTLEVEKGDKSGNKGDTAVSPEPSLKATVRKSSRSGEGDASPVAACFEAYQQGIRETHKAEYPPSARANGILSQVVAKLGSGPALEVVRYYVRSTKPFYLTRRHPLEILAKDATTLWLEIQQATGERAGTMPTAARTFLVLASGSEMRLEDYPVADHLSVARRVRTDYARMISAKHATAIAVQVGRERQTYAVSELST